MIPPRTFKAPEYLLDPELSPERYAMRQSALAPKPAQVAPQVAAAPAAPVLAAATYPQEPAGMASERMPGGPTPFKPEPVQEPWKPNFADYLGAMFSGLAGRSYEPAYRDDAEKERAAALARNAQGQQAYDQRKAGFDQWLAQVGETKRHNQAMEARPTGGGSFVSSLSDDPASDASKSWRDAMRADPRYAPYVADNMSAQQLYVLQSRIGQSAGMDATAAGRTETLKNQKAMAFLTDRMRRDAELRTEGRTLEKEDRDVQRERDKEARALAVANDAKAVTFATDYQKANGDYLQMAGMVQDIRDVVGEDGSVDTGVLASLRSRFSTYFNGQQVTDVNAAKRMLLEKWSRTQSGAAISENEEERFARQTGADPYASEADVDAAFQTMERVVARTLRSGATGNPEAARAVADNAGLNEDWLANVKSINGGGGGAQQQPDNLGTMRGAGPKVDRVVKPKAAQPPKKRDFDDDDLGVVYE